MSARLSSDNLHATSVARGGRAVLITGPSGAGKSDLALRLVDRGFTLVSDDRTLLARSGGRLLASAPPTIRGKIEVRGIGIVAMDSVDDVPVALLVDLAGTVTRMPDDALTRTILGIDVPLVALDAAGASAPIKVELALNSKGLPQ